MDFFGCLFARPHGIFPRQDRGFKEFRGFPDMELGIFRVAKSSGGGRDLCNRPGPDIGRASPDHPRPGPRCPSHGQLLSSKLAINL